MTELPEVAWLYAFPQEKPITRTWADWKEYKNSVKFLRADTAIPKAEADAMVAAAYRDAATQAGLINVPMADTLNESVGLPKVGWQVREAILKRTPDDARAAFEQAVREAVEAERARCAQLVEQECDCSTMARLVAAIRAPQEASE